MSTDISCPFCLPARTNAVFAKTKSFSAIYNIAPILPGHSLIIPNKHIDSIMDLSDEELQRFIVFCRNVTRLLTQTFKAEAFNWSLQEKEAAGQTAAHLHWHIVPRYLNDLPQPGDWYPEIKNNYSEILDSESRKKLDGGEMNTIVMMLRQEAIKANLFPKE